MQFSEHDDIIKVTLSVTDKPLSERLIQEQLKQSGCERCYILQPELQKLLANYQELSKALTDDSVENAPVLSCYIAEKRPAELKFEISEDKMTAYGIITADWGGAAISANNLIKSAQENGIVFGFSKEKIISLVSRASKAEPGIEIKQDIANGKLPVKGKNATFLPLISVINRRRNKPVIHDDGKADLRDFGVIPSVSAKDAVAQRLPPTEGINGSTVTGEILPTEPGVMIDWVLGSGVEISADDPDILIATHDGLPRMIEHGATVDELFELKNVDLTTGHIMFNGSVIINGDVTTGMKVIAKGNIYIKGLMEGALLEAGGDIEIGGAVISHILEPASPGQKVEYSTVLQAKGNIQCNVAQYTRICCEGNVYVNKYLMHCSVEAAKVFAGPEEKPNGKIIGGNFYLDYGLYTGILGAPANSNIDINLNRQLDPLMDKFKVIRASVASEKAELADIKAKIDKHKRVKGNDKRDPELAALLKEYDSRSTDIIGLINDAKKIETLFREKLTALEVCVKNKLYSAVEIKSGVFSVRTRREYGPSRIQVVDNELVINSLL